MGAFLKKQWFLTALAAVLAGGLAFAPSLEPMATSNRLRNGILVIVMFLMALPLETSAVIRTIRQPWAALVGSTINMGLMPLLAWAASLMLRGELAAGVSVAAAAPCTLASAAVWTRRAGGNDATALLVTLITNGTCFVLMPLWLVLTTQTQTQLEVGPMVYKLALLVVLPMVVAQLTRVSSTVATMATSSRNVLATCSQIGILMMVLIGAVNCGLILTRTDWRNSVTPSDFLMMTAMMIGLHLTTLFAAFGTARAIGFERADQIAVAIAGSQKTLMVGLYVGIHYFGGLVILPMVVYHVVQLFLDTLIADRWAAADP